MIRSSFLAVLCLFLTAYVMAAPTVPTGVAASGVTANSLTLTWTKASGGTGGVQSYEVARNGVSLGTITNNTLAITGLTQVTNYAMKVRACDTAGNWSNWSSPLSVNTLDGTAPSIPTGLAAGGNTTGVSFTLSWAAATDNVGVTSYEVGKNGVSLGTTSATSMTISSLSQGTIYSMTVRARDAAGNWSSWSNVLSVTTPDVSAPSIPTGVAVSGNTTGSSFTLSWTASTDNIGVTGYEVAKNGVSYGTTTTVSLAITGLAQVTNYSMTVRARDAAGNWSGWSNPIAVTTPDVSAPSIPIGLSASANTTGTSFMLAWTPATDNVGVTACEVAKNGVSLGTTGASSMNITGLSQGAICAMTVRARDGAGNWSAWSAALTVTTPDFVAPSVPVGLSVGANTTGNSFTLSWTAATDNVGVTAYEVSKNGISLGTTGSTSLAITGLAQATSYSMKVRARDAAGNWSAWSSPLSVTTPDVTAPSIPIGLVASGNTNGASFTLKWTAATDNVGVTAYEIRRDSTSLGTASGTSLSITGLTQGVAYAMTVRARDAAGNWSAWSASLLVTTPDLTAPSVPTGLASSANTSGTSFTLSWTSATDNVGVTAYEVSKNGVSLGTTTATSLAITSLSQATTYSMKLRAGDAAGNWSAWSSPLAVTTPDVSAPSIPAGLKASGNTTGSSFTLIWTQSTDNVAVTAYEVRRDSTSLGTTSGISLNVTGLTQGAAYAMTVRAGDAAGNWSEWSLPLSATTPDLTAPSVPSGIVSPSQTPTTIDLSWNPSTDNIGVTGYDVYMGDVLVGSPTTNAYVVTGLAPSTTYSFTIKAKDAAGNASDASSPYSVKTAPPPPSIPSGLVASDASATSFTLSWTASTGGTGGIASYDIYLNGALVGNSTSPSFALTGLTPSTTYTLTVQSKDTAGNISGASSVLTFTTPADTTPPDAPANLIASAITATSFTLTWTPSSDDVGVAGYTIFNGGVPFGTATAATYNAVGLTPSTIYSISVAAYDAAGNTSTVSDPLSVTTGTNQPPTVSLVTPAANDAVTLPGTITLTAIASDSDGTVAKVEFFSGTTKIGEASAAPYSCTWTATSAGIVSLTAVATDNYGASTISDAVVITLLSGLPYTTDFEAGEGYTTGPLDAQLGWSVPVGSAQVSASDAAHGTQAVILNPDAQINQAFGSSGINPPVVYVDFYAKPAAGADTTASTLFDVGVARVAFVLNGNSGQIAALNGDGVGAGSWTALTPAIPLDGNHVAASWQRLTLRLDYVAKTYDLYLNGHMIAADLRFRTSGADYFALFSVQGSTAAATAIDALSLGSTSPLFADSNSNGIDDDWETAHGLSLTNNNRNTSPTNNGVTVVQAYVEGTDPNDCYNGAAPTVVIIGGNNQLGMAGQFNGQPFDVAVWNPAGTAAIVNAPVSFTVQTGGGKLATNRTGNPSPSTTVTLTTDADGTAQVYYLQPSADGVQSQIVFSAGTAHLDFFTSTAATLDSDGDGIPDAWEIAYGLDPYDASDASALSYASGRTLSNLLTFQSGQYPIVLNLKDAPMPTPTSGAYKLVIVAPGNNIFGIRTDWEIDHLGVPKQ